MAEELISPEGSEQAPLERQAWWQQINLKTSDIVIYVLVVAFVIYTIYSLVINVYRNYQTKTEINKAKEEILTLQIEKERLQSLLSYYDTRSYQEIELRRRLLLKKPGEIVVALNGNAPLSEKDTTPENIQTKTELPPIWQWYDFYFKRP